MKRSKKVPSIASKRHKKQSAKLRLSTKRIVTIYVICLCIVALAAIAAATVSNISSPYPDPYRTVQRQAVDFKLYYPTRLPEAYEIDMSSLGRVETTVVAMRIADINGNEIQISQQKAPQNFDYSALYNSFTDTQTKDLPLGKVTIGVINNDTVRLASLVTDDTWILVQSSTNIKSETILDVLSHLKASNDQ